MGSNICCKNEEDHSIEIRYDIETEKNQPKNNNNIQPTKISEKKVYN